MLGSKCYKPVWWQTTPLGGPETGPAELRNIANSMEALQRSQQAVQFSCNMRSTGIYDNEGVAPIPDMSASGRGGRGDLEAGPEPVTDSGLASGFSSTAGWSAPSAVDMRWRAPGGQSSGSSNGGFTGTSGLAIQSGGAPPSTQSGFAFSQPQSVGLSGSGGQASVAARELIVNVQPLIFILTLMFLLMLLSFPQASEFLWVFIREFVAAMLRGLSLYRHLADKARAQHAFTHLPTFPPPRSPFFSLLRSPTSPPSRSSPPSAVGVHRSVCGSHAARPFSLPPSSRPSQSPACLCTPFHLPTSLPPPPPVSQCFPSSALFLSLPPVLPPNQLWVFIGAFVAAMLRGLSLYRHLADQARAQRAFARLLGLPPSSTSFLLSNPSALASPFPPFGPPFSNLPFQPSSFSSAARGAAAGPLPDLPSFPSLSPFPAFPSSLSPSISPSSSSGNLSQSTSAVARSASAGAESAASASAAQRMHMQQPQAQALSDLGGEWFGVGERGGRMEDGSLLAARIGSLVRAQLGQQGASQQQQLQQQQQQQQQGQQEEGDRMWLEHQAQLRRLQQHLGLQLALMHRELQASDYELLRALDADNTPSVPAVSDVEIARLPAFPYKPKRSRSGAHKPRPGPVQGAATSAAPAASDASPAANASRNPISTQQGKEGDEGRSNSEQCTVCLEPFQEGEMVRLLPCLHQFHSQCIDQWLQRQANCPICKHQLVLS
ncbi:unnamed protein product [Closterium sp. Yama58-4]|nr:unnamed protein product [Closterium sp. Yama58-4]